MRRSILVIAMLAVTTVAAEPGRRVVLVDPDPALERALAITLEPWQLEVVVDADPIRDTAGAEARARTRDARFVVWRRRGDLVVYDRERNAAEFRDGKPGELDAADAHAAALSVKSLMRLPPPDTVPTHAIEEPRWTLQVGLGARFADGAGARGEVTALVRPTRLPWHVGLAIDLGPRNAVSQANFRGDAGDLAVAALASWRARVGRFGIEPFVGGSIHHLTVDGDEGNTARSERATFLGFRLGAWGRYPLGRWSIGPMVALDLVPAAPAFARMQGNGNIYEAPGFDFHLGAFAALGL